MKKLLAVLIVVTAACGSGATATTPTVAETAPSSTQGQAPSSTTTVGAAGAGAETLDVVFPSQDLDLVGSLRLPDAGLPAPGVVLIHGSGPQSRDSALPGQLNMVFGFEIEVFAEIAEALRDSGFAVLSYDKRSCGPFNGCSDNGYPRPADDLTIDAFVADARAAVDYLRSRPEVQAEDVSVIGHSQGAQFVPVVLESDTGLSTGVMIAGPYRPIDEIISAQLDFTVDLLGQLGVSEQDALESPGVASQVDTVEALARIRSGSEEPAAGASAAFWRSWFDLHEQSLSAAFRVTQPLLILNGELDWNVDVSEAEAWDEFLAGAGADYEVVTLPCVTHALNCVTETDPAAITPGDIGQNVSTEVTDTLIAFLSG